MLGNVCLRTIFLLRSVVGYKDLILAVEGRTKTIHGFNIVLGLRQFF